MSIKINSSVLKFFLHSFLLKYTVGIQCIERPLLLKIVLSSTASGPPLWELGIPTVLGLTPDVWNRIPSLAQAIMLAEENNPSQSFQCHMGK